MYVRLNSVLITTNSIFEFRCSSVKGKKMGSRRGFLQNVLAGAGIFASAKVLSAQEMQMPGARMTTTLRCLQRRRMYLTFRSAWMAM